LETVGSRSQAQGSGLNVFKKIDTEEKKKRRVRRTKSSHQSFRALRISSNGSAARRRSRIEPVELSSLEVFSDASSMDIKNALNAILPPSLRKAAPSERSIKAGDTTDRDANGQAAYDQNQQQQHREPMTEEQLKKALEHLTNLPAVKDHNLSVELVELQGKKFVLLKETDGKILRKIPESELWTLPVMSDLDPQKKGQLLRKTA